MRLPVSSRVTGSAPAAATARARAAAYALIVYALAVLVATTSAPIGLLPAYAGAFHLSAGQITLVAAGSTFGVMIAVPVLGGLSDAVGRRPVLLSGLALGAASLVGFLAADGFAVLMAARIVAGVAVAVVTGAGTAALTELTPSGDSRRAATHAATAAVVGFAAGPVFGGAFVEYASWPLRLVYVVGLALTAPAFAGVALAPETVAARRRFVLRLQIGVPRAGLSTFAVASLVAACCFATASFFQALGGIFVVRLLDVRNLLVASAVVACFLGTSALGQVGFRGLAIRRATVGGLTLLPAGLALIVGGLLAGDLPLFVAGAGVGGLGQGLAYLGGQSLVERAAPPERRGELFSLYLVIVYVSGGASAIALGFVANAVGLRSAAVGYAAIVGAVTVATVAVAARTTSGAPSAG